MTYARALLLAARPRQILLNLSIPAMGFLYAFGGGPLPLGRLGIALLATALLFAHVLLLNNYADYQRDVQEGRKPFLMAYERLTKRDLLMWGAVLMPAALSLSLFTGCTVTLLLLFISLLWCLYSFPPLRLKSHWPGSSIVHLLSGMAYFFLGVAAFGDRVGGDLLFALFFGFAVTAGQWTQDVVDVEEDRIAGRRSGPVAFGPRGAYIVSLVLFGFTALIGLSLGLVRAVSIIESLILFDLNLIILLSGAYLLRHWEEADVPSRFVALYRVLYLLGGGIFLVVHLVLKHRLDAIIPVIG